MIDFKNIHSFYDQLENKFYKINRDEFINIKIDNVIEYCNEESNFQSVVDMSSLKKEYMPFEKSLLYGNFKTEDFDAMIYFLCVRIKEDNTELISAGDVIKKSGKIITEFPESEEIIWHGKHGAQIVDMFVANDGGSLIYSGGRLQTFNDDYSLKNSFPFFDMDSKITFSDEEISSMFVHFSTSVEFFHCKNVKVITKEIPPKLKKAQIKRTGRAKLEESTVKVFPYIYSEEKSKRNISLSDFTSKENAHLTRGHFRTYTEAAPLFGKFVGTYFVSPHWRGNKENKIKKDYEIFTEK